jgi:hypothetical protein
VFTVDFFGMSDNTGAHPLPGSCGRVTGNGDTAHQHRECYTTLTEHDRKDRFRSSRKNESLSNERRFDWSCSRTEWYHSLIERYCQSAGALLTGQNSGEGRVNSTPTCACPPIDGEEYATRASCSSELAGFTNRSFWPISTFSYKTRSAPCALNAMVRASSRKGLDFVDSPQTMTGRQR